MPPVLAQPVKSEKKSPVAAPPISELELRALQALADRHGPRWRTVLMTAHEAGTLRGVLQELMVRPEAGSQIARVAIIPRSLKPVALYYGPLHFS